MNDDELRRRVIAERNRLGYFSARSAASAAQARGAAISNTTWSDWEAGNRPIGDKVRRAVMVLFGWPHDWPESPPDEPLSPPPDPDPDGGWATLEQHVRLQDQVDSLIARVQELDAEVARLRRRADRDEK